MFKSMHTTHIKICRRKFECLRPKNIRITRNAQRLQCCCTYHTNMSAALCDPKSLKCVMGECGKCSTFPKIDNLNLQSLKCCKECVKKQNDCQTHTVKVRQYEYVTYNHNGKEKKKMQLVDKWLTLDDLVMLLKSKLKNFRVIDLMFNTHQKCMMKWFQTLLILCY